MVSAVDTVKGEMKMFSAGFSLSSCLNRSIAKLPLAAVSSQVAGLSSQENAAPEGRRGGSVFSHCQKSRLKAIGNRKKTVFFMVEYI